MANWKYEIGQRIVRTDSYGNTIIDFTITNREVRQAIYQTKRGKNSETLPYYEYKCNICGAEHLWRPQKTLTRGKCACCTNKVKVRGINTIGDLHKEYLPYFADDDAFDPNLKPSDRYDAICPDCGHTKNIIISKLIYDGLFHCDHCNSFGVKRPELVKYLVNKEDANLSFANNKKVLVKCPDCGDERLVQVSHLYADGYRCVTCGDGVSFPEKFLSCVLEQLNVDFVRQLSQKRLSWCGRYKYDFYIASESIIIETHGAQHYDEAFYNRNSRTLEEEKENDKNKEHLATQNGIGNYIILDCRRSKLDWIRNSILNSRLAEIYDLSNIDWDKCAQFATSSLVKKVCDYWAEHGQNLTTRDLAPIFKTTHKTISKYLKQGAELGWCEYDVKKENEKRKQRAIQSRIKKVAIFKDGKCLGIFESVSELSRRSEDLFGVCLARNNISSVCCGCSKHHKGFTFKYVDENTQQLDLEDWVA